MSANSANLCKNDRCRLHSLVLMSNIYVSTYVQNSSRTFVKRVSRVLSSAAWRRRRGERRRRQFLHPSVTRTCQPHHPTLPRPDFTGSRIFRRRSSSSSSYADALPVEYRAKLYIYYIGMYNVHCIQINTNNTRERYIMYVKYCLCAC